MAETVRPPRFQESVGKRGDWQWLSKGFPQVSPLPLTDPHHMVIKPFVLLGLAAKYRSRRWIWSTLPPTIRCLWHSPANQVDSAWDDQLSTFTQKTKIIAFWATLSGLRGNVRTPSIARWKARGQLYIPHNWTFSLSLTVETLQVEIGRSWRYSLQGRECRPPTTVGVKSSRVIALSCSIKIPAAHHLDLSQSMRVTDRQTDRWTDRRNYNSQDHPCIC